MPLKTSGHALLRIIQVVLEPQDAFRRLRWKLSKSSLIMRGEMPQMQKPYFAATCETVTVLWRIVCRTHAGLDRRIVNGFNNPTDFANFFMTPEKVDQYLAKVMPARSPDPVSCASSPASCSQLAFGRFSIGHVQILGRSPLSPPRMARPRLG